ncbi:MAG: HAD hydrolase family protein [Desulfobacteraceae bacterium]|nr:HAD hydrolase family protein [Desulfobacteraceae bacterium]
MEQAYGDLCLHNIKKNPGSNINGVVCDLDGTLLYSKKEAIGVKGRSGISFLGKETARLLAKISRIFPLIIATGRNAVSTARLVKQLPDVRFKGFVLENGFVVKENIHDIVGKEPKWEKIARLFPDWERLPFYENCVGFIPPPTQRAGAKTMAEMILKKNGYCDLVYGENKKIFIYPGAVDKMRGLLILGIHPYIALGDEINDLQMIQESTCPVIPDSGVGQLKTIVTAKNGFCSLLTSHEAARDMLDFAYKKISNDFA